MWYRGGDPSSGVKSHMPSPKRAGPAEPTLIKTRLARMDAKLDALGPAVAALLQATQALTGATAALLQIKAHPLIQIPSARSPVPRGTLDAEEPPLAPLPDGAVLDYALLDDPGPPQAVAQDDYAAQLAAELAEYAEEDETPPPPDEIGLWRRRLQMWASHKMWQEDWGPKPGQDGCLVPPALIMGRR